jgi:hypothetical protein
MVRRLEVATSGIDFTAKKLLFRTHLQSRFMAHVNRRTSCGFSPLV